MKNQKGITLIALVITIIVLLILAGVSIAMLTGDNGLLTRTKQATMDNAIGAAKDEISLEAQDAVAEFLTEKYTTNNTTAATAKAAVLEAVKGLTASVRGCDVAVDETNGTITVTKEQRKAVGTIKDDDGTLEWAAIQNV